MPLLSPKAILEGRKSNRAPISLIIGLIACGLCALVALALWVLQGGAGGVLIGAILALPTFAVLAGVILLINRLDPEPPINLALAVGWGCGVAILGAFLVNNTGEGVLEALMGKDAATEVTGDLLAPIVEESFKGSLLLLLFLLRRNNAAKYIKNPTDGLVYAGLCALGFAFVENILYYMGALSSGGLAGTVLVRGVVAPLSHPLFTSMTALGVAYAATHRGTGRVVAIIGGWGCAVGLHALWNTSLSFGFGGMLVSYPIDFLVLVVLVVLLIRDRRLLVREIRTYLPAYVPSGLVQPHDVDMLGSMSGRRQARRWALSTAGIVGARAMGDYQLAATELALLHAHAANGVIGPQQFLGRQAQIVGLMRAAQNAFFRRAPQRASVPPPSWTTRQEQSGFFAMPNELKTTRLPTAQFAVNQGPPRGGPPGHPPQGGGPPGRSPQDRPPHGRPPVGTPPRPPASPPRGTPRPDGPPPVWPPPQGPWPGGQGPRR